MVEICPPLPDTPALETPPALDTAMYLFPMHHFQKDCSHFLYYSYRTTLCHMWPTFTYVNILHCTLQFSYCRYVDLESRFFSLPVYRHFCGNVNQESFYNVLPQSTYIYRVPRRMSPRRNWDSPTPLSSQLVCTSPRTGGGHTRLRPRGGGESQFRQFRRLEKKLSILPTLCVLPYLCIGFPLARWLRQQAAT